jgi:hypothetical protein
MELVECTVRLAGSIQHTVPKAGVTPPEILILKHIHGADAVVDIRPAGTTKRPLDEEWDRLARSYDAQSALASSPGEQRVSLMERLFGGMGARRLPKTLKEIGLAGVVTAAPATPVAASVAEDGADDNAED